MDNRLAFMMGMWALSIVGSFLAGFDCALGRVMRKLEREDADS